MQWFITTLFICPKLHPPLITQYKRKTTQERVLFLRNGFPKPYSIPIFNFTKPPPTLILSIFAPNCLRLKTPFLVAYHQLHLHKNALFNKKIHQISNSPMLSSKHTVDHFTRCIFFTNHPPLHKKSL